MSDVSGHREGLQVDLRAHDRRAEIKQHAFLKVGDGLGEDQKVVVRRLPDRRSITIRVLVNNIVANPDMNSYGYF